MSGTDPLTGARYPTATNAVSVPQDIQNAVNDLSDNMFAGPFSSASARDTAFSAWVAQGHSMIDGLHCFVSGLGDQTYANGAWVNDSWTNLSLASPWTAYVGSSGIGTGVYDGPAVQRVSAYQAKLRGWITCSGATAAGSGVLATPLASTFRPSKPRPLMVPWEDTSTPRNTGVTRFEVYTDGQIYTVRGVGANTYCLFSNLNYDL